jgi:eukaryotic-like serine/threonine-protein kinase
MPLIPGARLGPYEIVAAIGAGGMGEVYRGRDTRLDRAVAIKVLPGQFAADPELRARFDREARAVSSLNHPHICALYDIGCEAGTDFLVLELLEGDTLAARLALSGALPPADALKIAVGICGALDRAHRAGIVHRDLKPANVMLTKAGAKLLDFGLAKTAAPVVAVSGLSMMPTTPHGVTQQGAILGTFQYMAPEQIEGLEADARTDIFAFGALLFEMLTGRPAFEGKTRASLLGAILKDEPPRISTLTPLAPPSLDRIVATCLAKDAEDRYQSAGDLLRDLKWIAAGGGGEPAARPAQRSGPSRAVWMIAASVALILTASTLLNVRHLREVPAAAPTIQFTIAPPDQTTFGGPPSAGTGIATQLAVSPDGRQVAFIANGPAGYQLWVRPLGGSSAIALAGTEEASFPFWSPDSRQIGFFANNKLKKMLATGGPAIVLCDAVLGRGATWGPTDVIVFSTLPTRANALQRVAAAGGVPTPASRLDAEATSHRYPSFLPDGRHFLFTSVSGTCCPPPKPGQVRIGTLDNLEATMLFEADSPAIYASGHVLYNSGGTLMARPFDPARRSFAGDAFPIAEHVGSEGSRYASFSVSASGVLVTAGATVRPTTRLTWLDRTGRQLGTVGSPAMYQSIALSPDERHVAVVMVSGAPENMDIHVLDVARGTDVRFTFDPREDKAPIWSPDSRRVVFQGDRFGQSMLYVRDLDGAKDEEPLVPPDAGGAMTPTDWSADGRYVAYSRTQGKAGWPDLFALPLFGTRTPLTLTDTAATETGAVFSPDGRWFAYQLADAASATQIFVQAFPPKGGRFQVSTNGGSQPIWTRDGKTLFFLSTDGKIMAAAVETAGEFHNDTPQPLFPLQATRGSANVGHQYAVTKDGRFLVNLIQQPSAPVPLTVVTNWLAAVQK